LARGFFLWRLEADIDAVCHLLMNSTLFSLLLTIFVLCLLHARPLLLPFLSLLYNYIPSLLNFLCFACVALKFQTFNQIQPPTTPNNLNKILLINLANHSWNPLETIIEYLKFNREKYMAWEEEKVKKKSSITCIYVCII